MKLLYFSFDILALLYFYIEGYREAFFYEYSNTSTCTDKPNLHWMFNLQRSIPLIVITMFNSNDGILNSILFSLSLILFFPFIHDGTYYSERNNINKSVYTKRFMDNSTTSNALINLNFFVRAILFGIGILIQTYIFIQ